MNRMIFVTAAVIGTLAAGTAFAGERCNVPKADWQPREALQQKLEDAGWQVKRIKTEDGCYEAYALDGKGRRVEAYFHPQTLEAVKTRIEG
jgi:hypothetical protein